jgi:hypothetical protein
MLKLFEVLLDMLEAVTFEKFKAFQVLLILFALSQDKSVILEIVQLLHHQAIHFESLVDEDTFKVTLHVSELLAYTFQLQVDDADHRFNAIVFVCCQ